MVPAGTPGPAELLWLRARVGALKWSPSVTWGNRRAWDTTGPTRRKAQELPGLPLDSACTGGAPELKDSQPPTLGQGRSGSHHPVLSPRSPHRDSKWITCDEFQVQPAFGRLRPLCVTLSAVCVLHWEREGQREHQWLGEAARCRSRLRSGGDPRANAPEAGRRVP